MGKGFIKWIDISLLRIIMNRNLAKEVITCLFYKNHLDYLFMEVNYNWIKGVNENEVLNDL
jgi:hypothetical protein